MMKKIFNLTLIAFIAVNFSLQANNIELKPINLDLQDQITSLASMDAKATQSKQTNVASVSAPKDCVIAVIGKRKDGSTFHESKIINNPRGGTTARDCANNVQAHLSNLEAQGVSIISFISSFG